MAFDLNSLIPQGTVLPGLDPNVITEEGAIVPQATRPNDTFSRLNRALEVYQGNARIQEEKRQKQLQEQMDMYKTLRESGYEPQSAYDAVQKKQFPSEPGGQTSKEKKEAADLEKTKAEIVKTRAQTKEIMRKVKTAPSGTKALTTRILEKVSRGEELTAGEQKVYDEYIRKYGKKSDLNDLMYVSMTDPKGKKVKVHKDDVEQAIKEGFKRR